MATTAASSGSFLITPNVGLMIWTLLLFGISMLVLWKLAFPRIAQALERPAERLEDLERYYAPENYSAGLYPRQPASSTPPGTGAAGS